MCISFLHLLRGPERNGSAVTKSTPTTQIFILIPFIKILQEVGIPDHLICLLRNLYAGQEATALSSVECATHFYAYDLFHT